MIRYVLIVALAATTIGLTAAAVDQVGTVRGERAVQTEIEEIESTATSLYEDGEVSTVRNGPQRIATVDLHDQHPTKSRPERITIERIDGTDRTRVTYRVSGGRTRETKLAVPLRHADGGPLELTAYPDHQRFVLRLEADESGGRVVTIEPYT